MKTIEFRVGAVSAHQACEFKPTSLARVAFAGRSNVGKSSLMNALTRSKAARVSSSPGKTREMNFFYWKFSTLKQDELFLVDLPGYGYAKVALKLQEQWGREITEWMRSDPRLVLVVVLVDGRHGLFSNDIELIDFLRANGVPYVVAFTKMDKWKSRNQRIGAERDLSAIAAKALVERYIFTSSTEKDGTRSLMQLIREVAGA